MPLHFIRPRLAGWLIAAAALQYPALSSAMESHNAGPTPVRQEQMLAALPPDAEQPPSAEPFGQIAVPITSGDSLNRWRFVENEIDAESAIVDRCLTQQECPAAARKFLDIVAQGRARSGLARVGVINRAVNLAIAPESDIDQWGVPDRWSPPLETLTTGHGDCEDYAIAKYAALLRAGMSKEDVKLVIVHRRLADEEHAVAAVRVGDQWFILDNRTQVLVPDFDVRGATPLVVLDSGGAKIIVPGLIGTTWAAGRQQPVEHGKAQPSAGVVSDVPEAAKNSDS
jgi:predicted transglutaminase-like cysteine proteinase